jgi:hypothetical protein
VNILSDTDVVWLILTWSGTVTQAISHWKVLFNDDCANCDRNVMFWSQENVHFTQEPEHNPLRVMSSAGVTAGHVTGPYFFNEPMSIASNLAVLEVWLKPQLRVLWTTWLLCGGMRTYFAVSSSHISGTINMVTVTT